jgi:minor histocompatibility antigen H13
VFGSCSLFGLYCAFKYLDPEWVQFFMSGYFALAGVFTLTATFVGAIKAFPNLSTMFNKIILNYKTKLSLFSYSEDIHLFITTAECVSFVPSMVIVYFYLQSKHYMLNNLIGMAFCIQAIENISVGSVKIATILQIGLFFYDIFWVFGTEVMVSVAKNVKGPLLLQFPRKFADAALETKGEFSMLGLGDIVIPGLFIALLYRLDTTKYINSLLESTDTGVTTRSGAVAKAAAFVATPDNIHLKKYPATYFHAALVSYAVGLMMTVGVMFYFGAAQPALLYLVPCALTASTAVAASNKELMTTYWNYTEEVPEEVTAAEAAATEGAKEEEKKEK